MWIMTTSLHGSVVLMLMSLAWAMLMLLLGLGLMFLGAGFVPLPVWASWFLGMSGIAGGQFVFMVLVADRFVPRAPRSLVGTAELGAFVLFVIGIAAVACLSAIV